MAIDPLLTPEQVADILQIPLRTLKQWRYNGIGPPFKRVGRYVRYQESDLRAWIERAPGRPHPPP